MNRVLTKIQSRLRRRGVEVRLGDIREKYLSLEILDYDNPTEDELSNVVDYFVKALSLPVPLEQVETQGFEIESNSNCEAITSLSSANAPSETTNTELVKSTAQSLGVVLNASEIAEIASNVNSSSDDLRDSLDQIRDAVVAFVQYKSLQNAQKINDVIQEVSNVVAEEFNSNSQQLTSGLQSINQQLQQQNTDFKRKVSAAISAFKVPAAG